MKRTSISLLAMMLALLASGYAQAQAIEAVYSVKYSSNDDAKAAMEALFADDALRGTKATLYLHDFGVPGHGTHTVVADYDNYSARDKLDKARYESHGWAKYMLATHDSKLQSADLVVVIDDHGKQRHEAGYLIAYTMQVRDPAVYRAALKEMNDAIGNPGVLRFVAVRSGPTDVTHAVLIGAEDFAAANEYLDKLYASDAFVTFLGKVGDIRTVRNIAMYRRVGAWGY